MIIIELIDIIRENGRLGLLYVLALLFAIVFALVLHEIAHGLVALWNGDPTAKLYGRLSINPLKHFDILGLLMMLVVGFGWAKPVTVDPRNFKKYKTGCVTVSLAGIITNILLAFVFALVFVLLCGNPMALFLLNFTMPTWENLNESVCYLVAFFLYFSRLMVQLNVCFALFNLLPLYPLDGYRLMACFVNENNGYMRFARRYSLYIMLGLIALDFISAYAPLNLYIGTVGGWVQEGFISFWRLIFR